MQNGYGMEISFNGTKYEGEFKNGKKSGQGKMLWADESSY